MEMVPIIDPMTLHIERFARREIVAAEKLWHFSSLIIPLQEQTGKILVQIRPEGKTFAGRLDIFGGYVRKNTLSEQLKRNFELSLLDELFLETAVREANEELQVTVDNKKFVIHKTDLTRIGSIGGFTANNDILKEVSSVYAVSIPIRAIINTHDDINGKQIEVQSAYWGFAELISKYQEYPYLFSDGLSRILNNYSTKQNVRNDIDNLIGFPSEEGKDVE